MVALAPDKEPAFSQDEVSLAQSKDSDSGESYEAVQEYGQISQGDVGSCYVSSLCYQDSVINVMKWDISIETLYVNCTT